MRPRVGRSGLLLGMALAGGVCAGADRLVVVHDAGGTVPASPWIERPALSGERVAEALARAREQLAGGGEPASPESVIEFPVDPAPLRPGRPERLRVRGLGRALFAVGSDEGSRAWLDGNAAELRALGATGFLVEAASADDLRGMRERARRHGLSLDPLPGAALAESFGARIFPFVAEPSK